MAVRSRSFNKTSPIEISKSPPASKNLAHVPCKFFKQGACQAGGSCPFSHTVDATNDTSPCKYFQKGNCKFGVKCALAHILPDGRRVNPKTLAQVYQNHNVLSGNSNGNGNGNINGNGNNNGNGNGNVNGHGHGNNNGNSIKYSNGSSYHNGNHGHSSSNNGGLNSLNASPTASYVSYNNVISPSSSVNNGTSLNQYINTNASTSPSFINHGNNNVLGSQPFTYDNTTFQTRSSINERPNSFSFSTNSIWSNTPGADITTPGSSRGTGFYQRSVSHSSAVKQVPFTAHYININESAILDDDEEDNDDDNLMLQEDFVPSSLSDLLTPQELQRRGSRPSSSRPTTSFMQLLGNKVGDFNEDQELRYSSTEAIVDPTDENEMQFKMDDDDHYNHVTKNLGLSASISGLTL